MRFRLLGPVEVEAAGDVIRLTRRRERCLLAVLLLALGRVVPVGRLAELLWDGEPPDRARRNIHAHVSRLRAMLGQAGAHRYGIELALVGSGYRLIATPHAVDAHLFCDLIDESRTISDLAARIDHLRLALALWRGPALDNAASDWLRDRLCADLNERRLAATEDLMSASLALGRGRDVLPELARLTAEHPVREQLVALHLRALYQAGRRADALEAYARTRACLADQLGLEPGPALRDAHLEILRDEPPAIGNVEPKRATVLADPARGAAAPRQLPTDVLGFVGRSSHLDRLDALLSGDRPAAVVVSAIGGTAGIGKTALAVHWAHRAADRFPDGQLYVNLHGFTDPVRSPVEPSVVVRGFLEALQVPVHRMPTELAAQVGLYRSLLAGRRILILLDNAFDAGQVRPLLPGTPGGLVIVTSRNDLAGLVAEGATSLSLDLLSTVEARELLAHRIGAARIAAEPAAADVIIDRCARLPLALSVVAARAAMHPTFPLSALAAELPHGVSRGVGTALSYSYHVLSEPAARLFRLLGLHPGPDVGSSAAASLAGDTQVRSLLAELAAAHLITEHRPDRYTFHDLLRGYAGELARTTDSETERRAAMHRVFDHYLHAAHSAAMLLSPYRDRVTPGAPRSGVSLVAFADQQEALTWLEAEHPVLVAAVHEAANSGFDGHAWRLAWTLMRFLDRRGYWREWAGVEHVALAAAQRLGDLVGQAEAHCSLGRAYLRLGRAETARTELTRSLDLYREIDDQRGQASAHVALAQMYGRLGDYRRGLSHSQQVYRMFRAVGNRPGEAAGLNDIGWYQALLGRYPQAIAYCRRALAMQRELGDQYGQAHTWDSLGYANHHLGRHSDAIECYRQALLLLRHLGDRYYEANTLTHLGDVHVAAGEPSAADQLWQRALGILDDLDRDEADAVRERLGRLADADRGNVL